MNDGNGGERVGRGEEESGADLGGKREAQGPRGERGEWERGPRRRGELAPLSSPASVPARWSGGSAPLFRPGRGNREGGEGGEVGWAGVGGCGGAAQFGPGGFGADGPRVQWGGRPAPSFSFPALFLFSVFFLFAYFLFCFISFKSI